MHDSLENTYILYKDIQGHYSQRGKTLDAPWLYKCSKLRNSLTSYKTSIDDTMAFASSVILATHLSKECFSMLKVKCICIFASIK